MNDSFYQRENYYEKNVVINTPKCVNNTPKKKRDREEEGDRDIECVINTFGCVNNNILTKIHIIECARFVLSKTKSTSLNFFPANTIGTQVSR